MDKLPGLIVTVLILALLLWLMLRSWRRRTARDSRLIASDAPLQLGRPLWQGSLAYIATTPAEEPLERLAPMGLAYRGPAELAVAAAGLTLVVRGEPAVHIAAARLRGARPASWAIDRGVGTDSLIALRWQSVGEQPVECESYLRVQDHTERAALIDALDEISPSDPLAPSTSPLENA